MSIHKTAGEICADVEWAQHYPSLSFLTEEEEEAKMIGPAAFVIPYWDNGEPLRADFLRRTLNSILEQDDPNWRVYLSDDASPNPAAPRIINALLEPLGEKAHYIRADANGGIGVARNRTLPFVREDGCGVVCWLDADDQAHINRVSTIRKKFTADPDLQMIYSEYTFVDQNDALVKDNDLLPVLRLQKSEFSLPKLEGRDIWTTFAAERDNLTIPSAMNVRLELAERFPFPEVRFCEDVATWYRMLGSGAKIAFADGIETLYRVSRTGGSASRMLAGGLESFNRQRSINERAGLEDAIRMGIERYIISKQTGQHLLISYLVKIAQTVLKDGNSILATGLLSEARAIDSNHFEKVFLRERLHNIPPFLAFC